ncbi:PrgI family protein [Candidatus Wolfebacteria bacterium]|nr:PrgI family protein [Candidatus Wolfebacteria bacterium]
MQFQIPQFIDVEDKIVGPLTIRQFLFIAAAGFTSFVLFFLLKFWLWLILTAILVALAVAAAFIKYNSQPLPKVAWLALSFLWKPKMYLWQRTAEFREVEIKHKPFDISEKMTGVKKLWHDLMTTKTPIPKREKSIKPQIDFSKKFQIVQKITGEKEVARRVDYK